MNEWESMDKAFEDYVLTHPTYSNIIFSNTENNVSSKLHPMFVMSQFIIDSLAEEGKRRYAIILPDDRCQVITLVVARYFQYLQDDPSYAASIFESISAGQHVKLGKAVAEFLDLDREKKVIKYKVGKQTKLFGPTTITTPVSNYHLLLEKTEAEVSTEKKWGEAVKKVKDQLPDQGMTMYLDKFRQKRTGVKKTIVVFSQKNEARTEFSSLSINGQPLDNVLAFGELVDDDSKPYIVQNKGKLDCLPGIAVGNKLSTINNSIKTLGADSVSAVYCTQDKFLEIMDNLDAFKKILKAKIPVVLFVPEAEFEKYDILKDLGFVFWQWKPSTLKSRCFRTDDPEALKAGIYAKIAQKINKAAFATFRIIRCPSDGLSELKAGIRNLWKNDTEEAALRRVLIHLNRFHKHLSSVCTESDNQEEERLLAEWDKVSLEWHEISERYESNQIKDQIDAILDALAKIATRALPNKAESLEKCINDSEGTICVVLPDDYDDFDSVVAREVSKYHHKDCRFARYSEYIDCCNHGMCFDTVIVPWFDSSKYIKLKQTYCYKQLVYILYDFENRWRSALIKRIDSSFPHDELMKTAKGIRLSSKSITKVPFDSVEIETETQNPTKEDYDFDRTLLKRAVGSSSSSSDLADSVECVPVILSEETVAYFGTNHEVIDITGLCNGDSDRPEKIPAEKLSQGRVILIRQSGRDLIAEKADQLMAQDGNSTLREKSSIWSRALGDYSTGKTIQEVTDALTRAGYACSSQQVRYWILGETIRPNDIEAIKAIAIVCRDNKLMENVGNVYNAGGAVQEYHRKAGRWLTNELRTRATDIASLYSSGEAVGNLEGIGAIHLFTVEEVLSKEFVPRGKVNTLEVYA